MLQRNMAVLLCTVSLFLGVLVGVVIGGRLENTRLRNLAHDENSQSTREAPPQTRSQYCMAKIGPQVIDCMYGD